MKALVAKQENFQHEEECFLLGIPASSGADPGFSERGSENLKKGAWSVAPEALGICII